MNMLDLIRKKRAHIELSEDEIRYFVRGVTDGSIPDYQISAFLMAVVYEGLSDGETGVLTDAMAKSGETVDLSRFGDLSVDKHSTGGVGDKTTLIVAPIAASCGCAVAKMSGRGLGHTGGTVDKLESIRGCKTTLSGEEFFSQVDSIGVSVIGQSADLAPADKKLYALRDVTGTIDSIPLIASSIMSKKLAAGTKNIVLDVTVGSGAFMKKLADARLLAEKMVAIGKANNRNCCALITDMDRPLGSAVGNSLEVIEAINVLRGGGPSDLREVSLALSSHMISLALKKGIEEAENDAVRSLESGAALTKFYEWIEAQGGDVSMLDDTSLFGQAKYKIEVISPRGGIIRRINAEKIGLISLALGAGRTRKDDAIDFDAGLILDKNAHGEVCANERIATLYTNRGGLEYLKEDYLAAIEFSDEKPPENPIVYEVVE